MNHEDIFAKLFPTHDHGQILIVLDPGADDEKMEIRISFKARSGNRHISTVGKTFDTDAEARKAFDNITRDIACQIVEAAWSQEQSSTH